MITLIIHTKNTQIAQNIQHDIGGDLTELSTHFRLHTKQKIDAQNIRESYQIDANILPQTFNPNTIKAFVSDMDSTLINIECIDEIAEFAGLKDKVAAITEATMQGKLDFNASLVERVALLKNLSVDTLQQVYDEKLQVNAGAEQLIQFLQTKNIQTAVVSGGFDFFTSKLQQQLGLNHQLANTLEISGNTLTGKTTGAVINSAAKAEFVNNLPFKNSQIITCGDGANDLEMMKISGLSIAYHAKQSVNDYADIIIKFGGLDTIIDLF